MEIDEILKKCEVLRSKKGQDYTTDLVFDRHENFRRTSIVCGWFKNDLDKPYIILITTKLVRLASLLIVGKKIQNESIEDSFLDLINYCILWADRRINHVEPSEKAISDASLIQNQSNLSPNQIDRLSVPKK